MFWNIISNVLRGQTLSKMFRFHAYFHVHDFAYKYSNLRSALPSWNYRRLILRYQKGKNGWETTEKWQRIVLKKTGWTKKTLSLARKSFKIWENIKRKWEARNICRKQEVSSQNGRVGITLKFCCKNFFSWNQSAPDMFFWNRPYTP